MALTTLLGLVTEHWMLTVLLLCPIVIVAMALAALSCEVCGAPFGVFRRRNRTIDLCLRCALLHDIRRAKDTRSASQLAATDPNHKGSGEIVRGADAMEGADSDGSSDSAVENQERRVEPRSERRRAVPGELRVAGGPRNH
ncbi:MAG: hypothetical protein ABI311_09380 [Gemmatimonadaceae bacterium]